MDLQRIISRQFEPNKEDNEESLSCQTVFNIIPLNLAYQLMEYLTVEQIELVETFCPLIDCDSVWKEHYKLITRNPNVAETNVDNRPYKVRYFEYLFPKMHNPGIDLLYRIGERRKIHVLDLTLSMASRNEFPKNYIQNNNIKRWNSKWTKYISHLDMTTNVLTAINNDKKLFNHLKDNLKSASLYALDAREKKEFPLEVFSQVERLNFHENNETVLEAILASLCGDIKDETLFMNLKNLYVYDMDCGLNVLGNLLKYLPNLTHVHLEQIRELNSELEDGLVYLVTKKNLKHLILEEVNMSSLGTSAFITKLFSIDDDANAEEPLKLETLELLGCNGYSFDEGESFRNFKKCRKSSLKFLLWSGFSFNDEKLQIIYEILSSSGQIEDLNLWGLGDISLKEILKRCPILKNLDLRYLKMIEKENNGINVDLTNNKLESLITYECVLFNNESDIEIFKLLIGSAKNLKKLECNVSHHESKLKAVFEGITNLTTTTNVFALEFVKLTGRFESIVALVMVENLCKLIKKCNDEGKCNLKSLDFDGYFEKDVKDELKRKYSFIK